MTIMFIYSFLLFLSIEEGYGRKKNHISHFTFLSNSLLSLFPFSGSADLYFSVTIVTNTVSSKNKTNNKSHLPNKLQQM